MQYQFTERTESIKTILFKNSSPLHVELIRYFKEDGVSGTFTKKEFRYSFDNSTWTNWNTLTQGNLSSIQFRDNPDFYLEVQYTRTGIGSGNILRWYLFYDSAIPTPPTPPGTLIDADLLQGEPGSYYLNRDNFYGPYEDLILSNVPDGSAVGVYSHRVDTSEGTEFFFKRIEGTGSIIVSESSSGIITIDSSGGGSGSGELYYNPDPVLNTVGGISSGSTFFDASKGFAETMQAMFYPTLYPTLTAPSNSFGDNVSNLQIIGDSINITFTSSLNRGSISPQYTATSPYRSGLGYAVHYTGYGLPSVVGSTPSSPNTQILSGYTVLIGTQTWSSAWDSSIGVQPKDSIGGDYMSPYPASTTSYQSTSFEGVYPLFGTTVNISTYTEQPLVSMLTGNNISFNMVSEIIPNRQGFDIPDIWLASRSLSGVDYNDPILGWQPLSLSNWIGSSVTHVIEGNTINYTRYNWSGIVVGAREIRIKFS